ncbi:MAG: glycosyltransferase family 4 protein [Acidimicrobiales bacterium]
MELPGRVDALALEQAYRQAPCAVTPAFDEDFGLTAIEAMAAGKPVVCCRDGGGLAEIVTDGVDGFVVEPTGKAIAGAVEALLADPSRAQAMGAAARETAAAYSWTRAKQELRRAVEQVME